MSEYDDRGKVSVWAKREGASEKAPTLSGKVVAHRDIKEGEELDIALWKNEKYEKGGRQPWAKGKIQDKRVQNAAPESPPPAAPEPPEFNDDIPF